MVWQAAGVVGVNVYTLIPESSWFVGIICLLLYLDLNQKVEAIQKVVIISLYCFVNVTAMLSLFDH